MSYDPAAAYYSQFGRMLTSVDFPGRKKHPSTDPANSLLSLGYVLLAPAIAGHSGCRLTLRLFNRSQCTPEDFEGGERGLRLSPDAFRRYLGLYEDQLNTPSEGKETPTWREQLRHQTEALKEMALEGSPAALYTWTGRRST